MDAESFEALGPRLELRAELGLDPRGPVFCTFTGREADSSYVRDMCRRLRTKLGLPKRVHVHPLFREGMPERLIQVQLAGPIRVDASACGRPRV